MCGHRTTCRLSSILARRSPAGCSGAGAGGSSGTDSKRWGSTAASRIRSMKSECTRRILVPFRLSTMGGELGDYATWFNEHRSHEALGGRSPREVYRGLSPANEAPRLEPRARWPRKATCALPNAPVRGGTGTRLLLKVTRHERRKHLPIVTLRRVG